MSGILCSIAGATYAAAVRTAKTVTPLNQAQVSTAQSKFGGASALFDGTGDGLQVSAGGFNVGTGDITLEAWVRHSVINDQQVYFDTRSSGNGFIFYVRSDNKLEVYDGLSTYTSTVTMAVSTLYHLALSRSGSTLRVYRDGVEVISGSNSRDLSDNSNIFVGISFDYSTYPGNSMNGHMDEIRISNTARYTTTFTPSTTPFTNDANTLLLLHCNGDNTGTTFVDDVGNNEIPRTPNTITANGNVQISTAQSKFGGASALFDGNGDYLTLANNSDFNYTGDYTIEGWWYQPTNVAAGIYPTLIGTGAVGDNKGWQVTSEPTTNKISYITSPNGSSGMAVLLTSGNLTAATWNHWAVVRNNSVLTLYINGTASGSTYTTTGNSIASTYPLYVGGGVGGLSSGNFSSSSATVVNLNGYLDEIRVSNTARYIANFTAPTAAFSNDRNTLLLIHCNGTNAQTTFFDDNIWANTVGNTYFTPPSAEFNSDGSTIALWHLNSALTDSGPSALTLSTSGGYNTTTKKFGTASGDLSDSTTDFFARATTGHYWIYGGTAATGARQYTIEFWTYNTVFTNNSETDGGGYQLPLTFVTAAAGVGLTTTGKMTQNQYPGPRGSTTGVDVGADSAPTSQWVHQAYVIGNDMKWRGYLDGKLQFIQTAIDPSSIYTTATDIQIGRNSSSGTNANLMIDEIRLSSTKRYGS